MPDLVRPTRTWRLRTRALELGRRTLVMGVINITPDSFSDGGAFLDPAAAVAQALRLLDDQTERLDVKLITTALKELRYAAKVFGPYRGRRKVTVFGSARTQPEAPEYQQAVAFGKAIAERGFMMITGGGEGIMGAAQRK